MKTAFITGVTGMVGSHLLDFLVSNTNWVIHCLIRWRSPLDNIQQHIESINKEKRIFLHYGDLRDKQSLDIFFKQVKPNYIFHLAAQSFPKTSFSSPVDTYETNIIGTQNLLQSIREFTPKSLIHVCSSSEVFGRVHKDKVPIREDCSFHPASPYAISKTGTDLIGKFFFEAYNLKVIITRMFTHTGPRRGDVFAESSFAKQIAMAEAGLTDGSIYVGNLKSLRTISDVRDAVKAYFMLLTVKPRPGEVYNIGGDYSVTLEKLLNDLIKKSTIKEKLKIKLDKNRLRPIDADLQVPCTIKFRSHTGWKPEIKYEQTINDLLEFWREKIINQKKKFLVR